MKEKINSNGIQDYGGDRIMSRNPMTKKGIKKVGR